MAPRKTTVATHEDLAVCKSDVTSIITEALKQHEKVEGVMYGKTLEALKRIEEQIKGHIDTTEKRHNQTRDDLHGMRGDITRIKLKEATNDGAVTLAKWLIGSIGGMGGLASILYFIAQR